MSISSYFIIGIIIPLSFLSFGFSSCLEPPASPSDQRYYVDSSRMGEPLEIVWAVPRDTLDFSWYNITPYMFGDNIVFAYDSRLHCVKKSTGETVWIAKTESSIGTYTPMKSTELLEDGNGGIIHITRDFVQCVSLQNGSTKWRVDAEQSASFSFNMDKRSCSETHLFVTYCGRFDNRNKDQGIWAINKSNGSILWKTEIFPNDTLIDTWSSSPCGTAYRNGRVYFGTREWPGDDGNSYGGTMFCLDAMSGKILWQTRTPGPGPDIQGHQRWDLMKSGVILGSPVPLDDGSVLAWAGLYLIKYDPNGKILWRKTVHIDGSVTDGNTTNPHIENERFYYTNNGSGMAAYMFCYDMRSDNVLWKQFMTPLGDSQTEGAGFPIQIDGDRVYKTTDASLLIGFNKYSGVIEWATNLNMVLPTKRYFERSLFGVRVEGEKVYFITANHLVCAQRKNKS